MRVPSRPDSSASPLRRSARGTRPIGPGSRVTTPPETHYAVGMSQIVTIRPGKTP